MDTRSNTAYMSSTRKYHYDHVVLIRQAHNVSVAGHRAMASNLYITCNE